MEPLQQRQFPNKLGEWIDRARRQRPALAILTILPVAITLAIAIAELPVSTRYALPCPIYPNGTVALTVSFHAACPLEFTEQIDGVVLGEETKPLRGDAEIRARITSAEPVLFRVQPISGQAREVLLAPVLIGPGEALARLASASLLAAILIAAVLVTAVRARTPASLPFSAIHAAAGVGIVVTVAGWTSSAFEIPSALARATLAAALVHLALVFPQRRGIVEDFPELIAAPYVFLYIVSAVEIDAAYGGSSISTGLALRLLLAGVGLAGCLLALSCYYAARESQSHLARGQARVFLAGIAFLSLPVSLVWLFGSPGARLAAVTLLAALLPFPVGYAISRYEVYDLDSSMRRLVAHGLYLSLWAGGFFLAIQLLQDRLAIPEVFRHPTVMYATIYGVLAPVDALRGGIKRRVRALMISQRVDWDRLGREFAHKIAAERSSEGVARAVCDAVRSGLSGAGVATFVAHGESLQVGYAVDARSFDDPERVLRLAEWARESVADLNRLDETDGFAKEAYDSGVGAIARVAIGDSLLGCIVVFPHNRGRLLGASEKLWIATLAGHAASALAAMRLEQELRVAERFAARGRMEAELAHEIGKPLGVLELTAAKLAAQVDPYDPLVPYLSKIARLAAQARQLTNAALQSTGGKSRAKLEDIVQRACLEVCSLHGDDRIVVHQLPDLGELPAGYDRLVRVLVNLLDNALRASAPGDIVELRVKAALEALEFAVEDRGAGMNREQLRRAFEPFASFRAGGTGLGLSISRQAVALLGGLLNLEARRDGPGMRAVVRVPR